MGPGGSRRDSREGNRDEDTCEAGQEDEEERSLGEEPNGLHLEREAGGDGALGDRHRLRPGS